MQFFAAVRGNEALGGCFWSKTSVAAEVRARHYQGAALRCCCCSDGAAYLPTYPQLGSLPLLLYCHALPHRSWLVYSYPVLCLCAREYTLLP